MCSAEVLGPDFALIENKDTGEYRSNLCML